MGPRSENRGYGRSRRMTPALRAASMGPRSENRGYGTACGKVDRSYDRFNGSTVREPWLWTAAIVIDEPMRMPLQWVHGPITVVMAEYGHGYGRRVASMGPRSDNRGYGDDADMLSESTVASMGPRSDNRGYGQPRASPSISCQLQWVHGPITVVMVRSHGSAVTGSALQWVHGPITVVMASWRRLRQARQQLQWVHGPITVVMAAIAACRSP